MRMFKKSEGFTLVELMVVVLIIGILVAIAIPVFNAAQESARRSACQNNLRVLDGAVQQWLAANPNNLITAVPDTLAGWALVIGDTTPTADGTTGQYVKDWAGSTACPTDDAAYSVAGGTFTCPNGHAY